MPDENKNVELKEKELEEVSGGNGPTNITYAYVVDQRVIDQCGWILTIMEQSGWDRSYKCPKYECRIETLPAGYSGAWFIGDWISRAESQIQPCY